MAEDKKQELKAEKQQPDVKAESLYRPTSRTKQTTNFHPHYFDNINFMAGLGIKSEQDANLNLGTENPIGVGIVNTLVDGVIGDGLALESSPSRNLLLANGITEKEITDFQNQVEAYWNIFANTPQMCDLEGKMTIGSIERLAFRLALDMGDVLLHIGMANVGNNLIFPRLQLISPRLVQSPNQCDTDNIISGVQRNVRGIEEGYHIAVVRPNEAQASEWIYRPKFSAKGGRLMFNLFKVNMVEAGQVRGRSIISAVKDLLINANRFTEAEVVKACLQASISLFIESDRETEELPESTGIDVIAEGQVKDREVTDEYEEGDERHITLSPGAAYQLYPGERAHLAESTAPTTAFMSFMETLLKIVGMAVGIPYEVLLKSFNASYSASQASVQEAARKWAIWRTQFAAEFLQPIYSQFVYCLVKQGLVKAPHYTDNNPFMRLAWEGATWHGLAVIHIDPRKSVEASIEAINCGLTTHEIEARKLFGNNFDSVIKRLGQEKKMFEAEGISDFKETGINPANHADENQNTDDSDNNDDNNNSKEGENNNA